MKTQIFIIFLCFIFFLMLDFCGAYSKQSDNYYYFLRLQMLKSQHEYDLAVEDAEKLLPSLQSNEDKSIILFELIQLNYLLSDYEKSRQWANKFLEVNPDDNITNIIIAKSYLNENNTEKAIEQLEKFIKERRGNLEIFLNLMSLYTQSKKQSDAINFLENTSVDYINDEVKYYFLLLLYYENKDYEKTLFYIDKYITVFESDSDEKLKNIQSVLQIIVDLLDNNFEKDRVLLLIKKLTEKNSSNAQLKIFYTQILIIEKKINEAIKILKDIQNKFLDNYKNSLDIFKLFVQAGDNQLTENHYKIIKEKYPNQKEIDFFYANYKEKENEDEAITIYTNLISDNNDNKIYENSLLKLTSLLRKKNKVNEAIVILEKSYNETKSFFILQVLLDVYFDEEMLDKAENIVKAEMQAPEDKTKSPQDPKRLSELKYNYCLILDKKGKHLEAINIALQELENDQNNPNLLNFIGYSYVENNMDLVEAEKFLTKAIAINPEDPFITDSMGWLYYKQKKYTLAIDYLARALNYEPDEPTLLEHIAEVYLAMGDKEKAREFFKKCLENIKKQNKDYLRVKERLDSLNQ